VTNLVSDFDYDLPQELIAQSPPPRRSDSRLLVLHRDTGRIEHRQFIDLIEYLGNDDTLVVNETRVRPARLIGRKTSGARVELLLLDEIGPDLWRVLCKPAKRLKIGAELIFLDGLKGLVAEEREAGERVVRLIAPGSVSDAIAKTGELALPPYIHEIPTDSGRYQTIYAAKAGSVAAPTAGLHFTPAFLNEVKAVGIRVLKISLDIGLDTFRPMSVEDLDDHRMHSESYEIEPENAKELDLLRARRARVIAVGTTTVRALESWARIPQARPTGRQKTDLFIRPGFDFMMTDVMLTNFHLPKSTLLVMVSAFAGQELIRRAYREAIRERYRFYSFGDAMLII
jgi:S-adenosylmethionine:tRNA ribosyltransferase-isomerase